MLMSSPALLGAEDVAGKVGIVLPTKDEPRWVQDETRFKEALEAAGYEVEILFSQGDSAKERANVEDLITKGVQVHHHHPARWHGRCRRRRRSQSRWCKRHFLRPSDP